MSKARPAGWFPLSPLMILAGLAMLASGRSATAADACAVGPAADAARNASSFGAMLNISFGRPEIGWAIYEPLIAHEIGAPCPGASPGFAAALARWRTAHRLGAGGVLDQATLTAMKQIWALRRPFVVVSAVACPAPPSATALATAKPAESYGGKTIQLRAAALAAYRRLVAAAPPVVKTDPRTFTLFSGFRSPDADAARCAAEGNCQGVVRASCSAHRTGLAMDMFLGAAPGHRLDSADDINRLYLTRTTAYRWLVLNADRFGFINYPFEPWHWEWTGERP